MAFDHKPHHWLSMVIMVYLLVFLTAASTISADTNEEILIRFKKYLSNDTALDNWNASVALCINGASKSKWSGVVCYNGSFYGLKLEKMGLAGLIDVETLAELSTLHSFSVMNNSFGGPVPEVSKLRGLKALFLSGNHFAGEIKEDAFKGMRFLKKVHLARNEFIGKVPKSLAALTRIMELDLSDNQFVGRIPKFRETEDWKVFNVSNNRFQGRIPSSLSKADPSSFAGKC